MRRGSARPRAGAMSGRRPVAGRISLRVAGAGLLGGLLITSALLGQAPLWLLGVYLGMGLLSGLAHLIDKRAAQAGRWRISEAKLHLTDLLGGIAGGLLAQQLLRHKTQKTPFVATTAAIWLFHVGGWAALLLGLIRPG